MTRLRWWFDGYILGGRRTSFVFVRGTILYFHGTLSETEEVVIAVNGQQLKLSMLFSLLRASTIFAVYILFKTLLANSGTQKASD